MRKNRNVLALPVLYAFPMRSSINRTSPALPGSSPYSQVRFALFRRIDRVQSPLVFGSFFRGKAVRGGFARCHRACVDVCVYFRYCPGLSVVRSCDDCAWWLMRRAVRVLWRLCVWGNGECRILRWWCSGMRCNTLGFLLKWRWICTVKIFWKDEGFESFIQDNESLMIFKKMFEKIMFFFESCYFGTV